MDSLPPLVLLTGVLATEAPGTIRLPRKFVSGLELYARRYPGPVRVLLHPGEDRTNLDGYDVDLRTAPFEAEVVVYDGPKLRDRLLDAGVVLGGPHHLLGDLAGFLRDRAIPYVYCTEYSLRTRLQIVGAGTRNPLRAARRAVWEMGEEAKSLDQVRKATAIQCNGTPTFSLYRHLSRDALLYFDTRIDADMMPTREQVLARVDAGRGRPIRLVFSGRFHTMKGVDHLPEVAAALVRLGIPFEMHLFGAGELDDALREQTSKLGLADHVVFHGAVDFAEELVPWVRANADLFVCCHRQGDPSCTYLETLSCGVPIAGYANEAWEGLLREAPGVGVAVRMDDPKALAEAVARYAGDPHALRAASVAALDFASQHLFAPTFERRVEQLRRVAEEGVKARRRGGARGVERARTSATRPRPKLELASPAPVLLHVGFPKTGSTWLQRHVFGGEGAGFYSPWVDEPRAHFLQPNPYRLSPEKARDAFAPGLEEARRRGLVPVITDEWLTGNQVTADYRGKYVADVLAKAFPDGRVLIVIREQREMLVSSYREYVLCGGALSLEQFLGAGATVEGFDPHCRLDHLEYDLTIGYYRSLYPDGQLMVEPFERMTADPEDFYARLAAFAGARGTCPPRAVANNVGLRGAALVARRALNNLDQPFTFQFDRAPLRRAVIARATSIAGRFAPRAADARVEQRLRDRIAELVGTTYVESNARTSALIGVDLATYGYSS